MPPSAPPPPLAEISQPALFLDFDGTLVEIAHEPGAIRVPEGLSDRIARLAARLGGRLALVTGRALPDIQRHLGAMAFCRSGSHGIDCLRADGSQIGVVPASLPGSAVVAMMAFAEERGLRYESKAHGGAIHYRANPEAGGPARVFVEQLADKHGLAVKAGKSVVELVRPGAEKGAAVQAYMREQPFAGSTPVFLGDDLTDEGGFAAAAELGGFGIIVGERPDTLARYRIGGVREVHEWLQL